MIITELPIEIRKIIIKVKQLFDAECKIIGYKHQNIHVFVLLVSIKIFVLIIQQRARSRLNVN